MTITIYGWKRWILYTVAYGILWPFLLLESLQEQLSLFRLKRRLKHGFCTEWICGKEITDFCTITDGHTLQSKQEPPVEFCNRGRVFWFENEDNKGFVVMGQGKALGFYLPKSPMPIDVLHS